MSKKGWGQDTGDASASWFGPRRQQQGIPQRRKRATRAPFTWSDDIATRSLLQKRTGFNDDFVKLFTGSQLNPGQPGKLLVVAESSAAQKLVDHVTNNLRNLSTTLVSEKETTAAELRGPVSWSETLSIRSTSYGMDYTHVCTVQKRSYDSPENRVIVAALTKVAESVPDKWHTQELSLKDPAIATAMKAATLLATRPLNQVKVLPVSKLTVAKKRARNSRKTNFYDSALLVLDLPSRETSTELAKEEDVLVLCNEDVYHMHTLVLEIEKKLTGMGLEPNTELQVVDGALQLGNIKFKAGPGGYVELSGTTIAVAGYETANTNIIISHPDELSNAIISTLRRRAIL